MILTHKFDILYIKYVKTKFLETAAYSTLYNKDVHTA